MKLKLMGLVFVLVSGYMQAEPTESREWASSAGTKVTGSALSVQSGKVLLKLDNGRELTVPLEKLVAGDQKFLTDHFGDAAKAGEAPAGAASGSNVAFVTDGLNQKIGEVVGPIDAGEGSHYLLYIPKTLRKDRLAPLMYINDAGGGKERSVKGFIEGAEICGWILAASVESKNGQSTEHNFKLAKANVKHLTGTLPVDPERVYFTGTSGGGAMSFYNAATLPAAGSMPQIGYIPDGAAPKGGDHFVCSGATDYNRYLSAAAVKELGKRAIHRLYVGGHRGAPEWLRTEGIVWLNGRYLAKNKRSAELGAECMDYEASMIRWIEKLSASEPHRAYYWCVFLRDEYKIDGANAALLAAITTKLAADDRNVSYANGIVEISDFSEKNYTGMGAASSFKHTTPKIAAATEKLAEKFAGVPVIEELCKELGKPTVGK